ncbi:uncharacterized protein N7483_000328 [Penicillium malachiteum]|uniref:uncharacterized protein n=1 Tax=Penicillium malachiteum TaxID=1324776 RepID=UPI0025490EA9|nr:uncharacterized protein N7483_000328 [Penicillium malachiteum]KAJ5735203.1 hypothetical protein N7483_000328 [Penicillium malachiteum]
MAGTGKSTIARIVAQRLRDRGLLGATFFFKRGKGNRGIVLVRLRVVLTSRPKLPVCLGFLKEDNYQDIVLHQIPALVIKHDIHSLPSDWPGNEKLEQLVQMSLPLFIFVATLCHFVRDKHWLPKERLTAILQDEAISSTSNIERMYLPVLNQLLKTKSDTKRDQLIQDFQDIVGVIVLLATPLSVVSLARLTKIPENKITHRLKKFRSVLSVPANLEGPVRILYLSFRDILLSTKCDFCIDEKHTHRKYKDVNPQLIQQRLPADLQYSCQYWVCYLEQSKELFVTAVLTFLKKHFLHWLEAISLMGIASEAIRMIDRLLVQSIEEGGLDSELAQFLKDAQRFILKNHHMIQIAPLQLHYSGLAFSPTESIIRK